MKRNANLGYRCYTFVVLMHEAFRFLFSEIRSGHTGTYGMHGWQFLANQLLDDKYTPRRKRVVAEHLAWLARKRNDTHLSEIAQRALDELDVKEGSYTHAGAGRH